MTVRELIAILETHPADTHVMVSVGVPYETVLRQGVVTGVYADTADILADDDDYDDDTPPYDGDPVVFLATHQHPDECELPDHMRPDYIPPGWVPPGAPVLPG